MLVSEILKYCKILQLIDVGFFVCFDSFLSLLTVMPTRIMITLWRLLCRRLVIFFDVFYYLVKAYSKLIIQSYSIQFVSCTLRCVNHLGMQ